MTTITRHLRTTVVLESVGNVDVSTIDLSQSTRWAGYETCLFWFGKHNKRENSVVVASYSDWQSAEIGHAKWTNEQVLAKWLIHDVR